MKLIYTVPVIAVLSILLVGCTAGKDPGPIQLPSNSAEPSQSLSEAPSVPSEDVTTAPTKPAEDPEPTKTLPTVTPAVPPAVEFAQRWGRKYPDVPEYAILKAANATCELISTSGDNWNDNTQVVASIAVLLDAAGMQRTDALEFAQDADQNYCSSVSNPT